MFYENVQIDMQWDFSVVLNNVAQLVISMPGASAAEYFTKAQEKLLLRWIFPPLKI